MSVILLTYGLIRRRIKNIRREAELKHKMAETEMIALKAQMNPHFIFNCLNAIDNLIQTDQSDKATTYLARFAKLIRSVLESSKNNLVPFYKDYESLQLFLQLEQFRCNNKFTYQLEADGELLQGDYKVPPLIVQPFVENAIHHGLLNKLEGEKKLIVKAGFDNSFIKYSIIDNGIGRARAFEIKERNKPEQASYGIQITGERIHLHNQNVRMTGNTRQDKINDLKITDLVKDGMAQGTQVEIWLKIDQ
jgi:sensor histidine kinase YesM